MLTERDQFLSSIACLLQLAADISRKPQAPSRFEQPSLAAQARSHCLGASVDFLHFRTLRAFHNRERWSQFEQQSKFTPRSICAFHQFASLRQAGTEMGNRFGKVGASCGSITCALIIGTCEVSKACLSEMLCQQ